jgi:hypothetical protein
LVIRNDQRNPLIVKWNDHRSRYDRSGNDRGSFDRRRGGRRVLRGRGWHLRYGIRDGRRVLRRHRRRLRRRVPSGYRPTRKYRRSEKAYARGHVESGTRIGDGKVTAKLRTWYVSCLNDSKELRNGCCS